MRLGAQRFIVQEDLDDLAPEDVSGNLGKKLQHYWDREVATKKKYGLAYPFGWHMIRLTLGRAQFAMTLSDLLCGTLCSTRTAVRMHSPLS